MINPCDIPIVEAALAYAQNGWPVFPLKGKIPFKDSSGLKDATTDPEQIQAWWTQHPTANIGLATGERSGIIVLYSFRKEKICLYEQVGLLARCIAK